MNFGQKFSYFSFSPDACVKTCTKLDNDESIAEYYYINIGCFGKSDIFVDHCDLHFCRPWDAVVCQNLHRWKFCSGSCAKVSIWECKNVWCRYIKILINVRLLFEYKIAIYIMRIFSGGILPTSFIPLWWFSEFCVGSGSSLYGIACEPSQKW